MKGEGEKNSVQTDGTHDASRKVNTTNVREEYLGWVGRGGGGGGSCTKTPPKPRASHPHEAPGP
jgi:hypothetical protein